MNKEFTRMQKLAGLITEGLYTSDEKAPMEAMYHSKMTKKELKEKIKEMMLGEETPGEIAYKEMGSLDEASLESFPTDSDWEVVGRDMDGLSLEGYSETTNKYYAGAIEGSYNPDTDPNPEFSNEDLLFIEEIPFQHLSPIQKHLLSKDSMKEADSDYTMDAYRIAREMVRRMDFPDAMFGSKALFLATIKALQDELYSYAEDQFGDADSAPDRDDDYDDSMDVYDDEYPDMAETMFEAKKDEESDTEDVIVADTEEVPAEDAAVDVTADETKVDVNMDGIPDVDTGSAESKKAFTSLVDTYNASKELGDPKLTQMIANALTYYNKNIILKAGQPQA